ncbi:MAG: hypothetical protein JNK25_04530 [Phycisphaerae bacterium]|nr:hypothetical protein [Phycisphaerae bacterium]
MSVQTGGWRGHLAVAGVFACLCEFAHAQNEVQVYRTIEINGVLQPEETDGIYNSGEDFLIDVPSFPSTTQTVRMYRITTMNPTADIGHITLRGERARFDQLLVLVSSSGVTDWPGDPGLLMATGCRHWSGITAENTAGDHPYLRRNVVVAASISGNLQGDAGDGIDVGSIYRLQVRTTASQTTGGNILLPVRACGENGYNGFDQIAYISVEKSIAADISAVPEDENTWTMNITSVTVGPAPNMPGISGRILAPFGGIDTIRATGPIVIPSSITSPGIKARDRLRLLYVGEASGSVDGLPTEEVYDIDAVIEVASGVSTSPLLERLRAGGDLRQPLLAGSLGCPFSSAASGQTYGIWVGGTVEKPITVKGTAHACIIRGATFAPDANVLIGEYLKGTVEAASYAGPTPVYGTLRSVTVGRGLDGTGNGPGFSGVSPDHNDPEGVIRADAIEHVDVFAMFLFAGKTVPPRIEANQIDDLIIGPMRSGVVTTPPGESTPYAVLDKVRIDHTYPEYSVELLRIPPEVWCRSFGSFIVTGNHAGHFYFPSIPADRAVRIGGKMENDLSTSQSPSVPGYVFVDEAAALHGQVVINAQGAADPQQDDYCSGAVVIAQQQGQVSLTADTASALDKLPLYTRTSGTIGGGAVGLAPFYMYEVDCDPPHDDMTTVIRTHEFDRTGPNPPPARPIKVRFYGPVLTDLASGSPVDLWFVRSVNGTYMETLISPTRYTVTVKRGLDSGFSREISILGNGSWKFPAGWYEVRRSAAAPTALYCDLILPDPPNSPPPVRDFTYGFYLTQLSSTGTGEPDDPDCPCPADFDHNGGVDGGDVEAFFNAWSAGGMEGDVNCDGGVDGPDVEWFFVNWENGGCD